jgi:hypothetical protein
MRKSTLTILALDPGSRNFGEAIIQIQKKEGKLACRVIENGKLTHTVTQLKDSSLLRAELQAYLKFIATKLKKYPFIQAIVAERFMSRGKSQSGSANEYINIMLGALLQEYKHLPIKVMPSAVWKNAVRRAGIDLKYSYKIVGVETHQLDACLIGIWSGCQAFGQKDFGTLNIKQNWNKLLTQIEKTSTEKLHIRRIKR